MAWHDIMDNYLRSSFRSLGWALLFCQKLGGGGRSEMEMQSGQQKYGDPQVTPLSFEQKRKSVQVKKWTGD